MYPLEQRLEGDEVLNYCYRALPDWLDQIGALCDDQ